MNFHNLITFTVFFLGIALFDKEFGGTILSTFIYKRKK